MDITCKFIQTRVFSMTKPILRSARKIDWMLHLIASQNPPLHHQYSNSGNRIWQAKPQCKHWCLLGWPLSKIFCYLTACCEKVLCVDTYRGQYGTVYVFMLLSDRIYIENRLFVFFQTMGLSSHSEQARILEVHDELRMIMIMLV